MSLFSKILPRPVINAKSPALIALNNELRALQLKPFKRLHFEFDPFHQKVSSIRQFLIYVNTKRTRKTNLKCTFKTDVLSNLKEPSVTCHLENGKKIIFKTANLTTLELLQYFNRYSDQFTEKEETN